MLAEQQTHYASFLRLAEAGLEWKGFVPQDSSRSLPNCCAGFLPDRHLSRHELRDFCQNPNTTDENAFIACMAWGGMNRKHGRAACAERERWLPMIARLRAGGLSREGAYDAFARANISGLGTAYFTKLLHFLRPERDGYILDQWTAKSVSLLFKPVFVAITSAGWVDRMNGADVYGRYCDTVERIAQALNVSGDVAEEMLFSRGGRSKHAWRAYVVENWSRGAIA